MRDQARHAVEDRIAFLLAEREQDPDRGLFARTRRGGTNLIGQLRRAEARAPFELLRPPPGPCPEQPTEVERSSALPTD